MAYRNIYSAVIFFVALFFAGEIGAQTTVQANRVIAKDSVRIAGRWVKLVSTDSTFSAADHTSLPTTKAVYDFVVESAIDTIYVIDGGTDPDTICIRADLCAVLPPGLSAEEVGGMIGDSLDVVRDSLDVIRDTVQNLQAAISSIEDGLASHPSGTGTNLRIPVWTGTNSLGSSTLLQSATGQTLDANLAFRITGGTTASRPTGAAGMWYWNTSNNWWDTHNGTSWFNPLRSATATGLGTVGRMFYADANGAAAADDLLYWNATDNALGVGGLGTTATDKINVTGSSAARISITAENTNASGNASFYFQNNRGGYASYGGLLQAGSSYNPGFFGISTNDKTVMISDGASSAGMAIGTITADPLHFGTTNLERMQITAAGLVSIGTTALYSYPVRQLDVIQSSSQTNTIGYQLRLTHSTSGTAAAGMGTGIELVSENASGGVIFTGKIENPLTTATASSESTDFRFLTMRAGTLTESLRSLGNGTLQIATLTGTATQLVGATAGNILTTFSPGYGLTFASGALRADTASANSLVTQSDLATGLASAADGNGIMGALPVGDVTINSANTLTIGSATIFSQINRSNFYVENASGDFGQLLPQLLRVYDADNDEEVEIRERSIVHTENSGQPMTISTTNELDVIAAQNVNISAGAGSYDLNITAANVQVSGDISAQNINAGSGLDVLGTATFRGAAEAEGSAVLYEAIANGINTHTLLAPASIPSNIRTRLPASAPTTESGVWERDASENSIFRAMVHSDVAGSTDGSGDITVSHDNDDGTFNVQVTVTGTTFFHAQVHTKTTSDFKIRFFDAAGAPVTSTAVTADYTLTDK